MFSRIARRSRALPALRGGARCTNSSARNHIQLQHRTLVSAPKPGDGPLMERRADRELPEIPGSRWARTMPIFVVLIAAASIAIFNYQKSSSPIVGATMYALRTNQKARDYLGDEVYFKHQIPWISGEMNQVRGRINISFAVKGTRNTGVMRFSSNRPTPRSAFETLEWSLVTSDGQVIDLLDGEDPFKAVESFPMDEEELEAIRTKGFRQELR
ncbi:cytochrome oxidase assembly [Microdochium trichocladiopsis]|uniref:Cytochrome oxidase assembly n=1 Tax=Microdochium trichocladiopsis TaxID=1682393 RepID=A0A9P8YKJ8_9PEZI|nr:cytochrome oxidase assembly [Microdochium trichocladiopsis]KAH7040719.1 cytochrome oxidase assembly [Microdochium trichocladiopsis]